MQPSPPPAIVRPARSPLPPAAALAGPWIAAPRPGVSGATWMQRHRGFVARARQGGIDVVFLGDSITDNFATRGKEAWDREIAPLAAVVDFGIAGDRTQYLLWRILNGELDGTQAHVVVVMIGTNNLGAATPAGVARGIAAVVDAVRAKLPDAIVVLNAILPRGDPDDPVRAKVAAVNAAIVALADGTRVLWVDAGPGFVDAGGTIPSELMPDKLHPSSAGYDVWATALRPVLLDALSK